MKQLLLLLIITGAIGACNPNTPEPSLMDADFLGRHTYLCLCCGGYQFKIDGAFYLAKQMPEDAPNEILEVDTSLDKPLSVRLTFELDYECQAFQIIKIYEIEID